MKKERQEVTPPPGPAILQRLLFLKVTLSRKVYLMPPFFIDFSLVKKAGMPAVLLQGEGRRSDIT